MQFLLPFAIEGDAGRAHASQHARAWFNLGFAQCEGGQERAYEQPMLYIVVPGRYAMLRTRWKDSIAARIGERQAAVSWLMKSAAAGFDVGAYVREDPWVEAQVRGAVR